jgi:hypothetical protein
MNQIIRDAYISIEIADHGLDCLRNGLHALFGGSGVECEMASSAAHVSIAYGEGDVEIEALERVASEIAALPFSVNVVGFEILSGRETKFDYLVVALEGDSMNAAVATASGFIKTRTFDGGFRSHLSLLKFPKGTVTSEWASKVIAEMNVCQAAALALGRASVSLRGSVVSVFNAQRARCLSKTFSVA